MIYYAKAAASIGAAIAIGLGTLGPAISQGKIASQACSDIGKYPESASYIRTTMLIALSFVETSSIYAFVIAILLIMF